MSSQFYASWIVTPFENDQCQFDTAARSLIYLSLPGRSILKQHYTGLQQPVTDEYLP
jgi:hypothetical protein